MTDVASVSRVDLRDVWPNEASAFTPWLAENVEALGEALGMDLELVEVEAPVGSFAVDVLAKEANTNRTVVIENQLEMTNHDHLGKVLTYAAGYNADVLVWVASEIREEHRQALDWLNQRTGPETEVYGVVVELLRIDDSRPAFHFDVVARPNQWRKSKVGSSRSVSEKNQAYRAFFQRLVDRLRDKHGFTTSRTASAQSWMDFSMGFRSGVRYSASFAQGGRARAEIYIDVGDLEENKRLFDGLHERKQDVESAIGESLSWERLDEKRASRIAVYRSGRIDSQPNDLSEIEDWMVDRLLKFKSAVLPLVHETAG